MSSLSGADAPARRCAAVNHAARLELLEYYLVHHEDLARCAQASLEWLARHAGVRRSVCLAVDGESSMLVGIAGYGVSNEDVELFSWPLSDTHDPLVARADRRRADGRSAPARANGHAGASAGDAARRRRRSPAIPLRGVRDARRDARRPAAAARRHADHAGRQLAGHRARPEDRADSRPRQPGRGSRASCAASGRCSSRSSTPSPTRFC